MKGNWINAFVGKQSHPYFPALLLQGGIKGGCFLIGLSVVCSLLFAGSGEAVDFDTSSASQMEPRDIYDSINDLVDSLQTWSDDPLAAPLEDSLTEVGLDSMDLSELFPECEMTFSDSTGLTTISLPQYLDLLTTSLQLDKNCIVNSNSPPEWIAPVFWDGENIFVDSIPIPSSGQITPDSVVIAHVSERIVQLRTIGLPEHLRSQCPEYDSTEVIVTVRGRDIVDIPFSISTWFQALSRISAGMQVYSGLLEVTIDSTETKLKFYVLITYPGTRGHHFIEWREHLSRDGDRLKLDNIVVLFSPYIRTDNLKNLFGKPKKNGREPIELRIK